MIADVLYRSKSAEMWDEILWTYPFEICLVILLIVGIFATIKYVKGEK